MDLRYTDDELAFRDELRTWLAAVVPDLAPEPDAQDWEARRVYDTGWQRQLHDAGYAGVNWPPEYGGRGASPTEHLIFLEETERAGAPYVGMNFVGLLHAGPTLMAEATDEQKQRYLAPILRGDEVWCQGFSEPDAGSDLASLRTRAVRDGDDYVVTGSKIWTSFGHVADFAELLVRTDPATAPGAHPTPGAPKHAGISWLILPMDSPGIEVRPLDTLVGSSEFCEVFLDEVRVPVGSRVGDENDGWRVAMVTFSFERGTAFVQELLRSRQHLEHLIDLADDLGQLDAHAADLGHLVADLDALWSLTKRNVSQASSGSGVPGLLGSVFKLHYSEATNRMGDLAMAILGRGGLSLDDLPGVSGGRHVHAWFHALSTSIAAGTSQIQRNILGERVLGLPKER